DRDLRELGRRHPLRQDVALPQHHAPERQALRGRLPQPGAPGDGGGGDLGGGDHRPAAPALAGGRRRGGARGGARGRQRRRRGGGRGGSGGGGWGGRGGGREDGEYNARLKRYLGIELI